MRQLWILVALVACKQGGGGEGGGGAFGGTAETPDWSAKKLVTLEGSIEGLAFMIEVPEGLPRDKRQSGDWEDPDPKYDHAPKIFTSTIEIKRIQDLKEAKYHATLDANAKTWVREQSRPDSWALTMAEPDKSRIEVIVYKQANDEVFIKCKAVQATASGPLPSYAKTRQMLEAICDSLKPTGVASDAKPREQEAAAEPTEKAPDEKPAEEKPAEEKPPVAPAPEDGTEGRLQRAAKP